MTAGLPELVREKWAPLLNDDGFAVVDEDDGRVELTSRNLNIVVVGEPRGEVRVYVFPQGRESWEGWSYSGMVGRASVARLLELALAAMEKEPAVLRGDPVFYDALAQSASERSREWTAFASGRGPRPRRPRLP